MQQIKNFQQVRDGLREYLLGEEKKWRAVKPFACPLLVVLSEPISVGGNGFVENEYEEGSLLCLKQVNDYPAPGRCRFSWGQVSFNKAGQIELFCSFNGSKFILSLVEFRPPSTYDEIRGEEKMAARTEPEITPDIKKTMDEAVKKAENNKHKPGGWKWNGLDRWETECQCGHAMYVFRDSSGEIFCLGALKNFLCLLSCYLEP